MSQNQISPINELQQLMAITAEECGELTQECMKIMRKYTFKQQMEAKWLDKLHEEAGDVYCMIDLLVEHGILNEDKIYARSEIKREKLKKWSNLVNDENESPE